MPSGVSRAAAKRTTGVSTSSEKDPTIEPPMWSTLPPPFTTGAIRTKELDAYTSGWGHRVAVGLIE